MTYSPNGSGPLKPYVRVATTANITLSGLQTIDGVSLSAGDRVLVKDQTTGSQNGIWVASSSSWTRAKDADQNAELPPGAVIFASEGATNGNKLWVITNDSVVIGTTALAFIGIGASVGGAQSFPIATITGATTLDDSHYTVRCDATSAGFTVTLPAAASCSGRIYNIKKVDGTSNIVTIDANGSETIDGDATIPLESQGDCLSIQSNGTSWDIL